MNSLISKAFVKNNQLTALDDSNNWSWQKADQSFLKKKVRESDVCGRLCKVQNILGNLENHTHVQRYACSQERTEKVPIDHFQLSLRLCTGMKWRLRQSCRLPAGTWKTFPNTNTEHLCEGWKKISVESLVDD